MKQRGFFSMASMLLEPPPYLSPSSLETFQQCPLKYKLSRIDKLVEAPSEPAHVGNYVHDVLEDLMKLPADERTMFRAKKLLAEQWNIQWAKKAAEVVQTEDEMRAFRWKAFWAVENYFSIEDPTLIVVGATETPIELVPVGGVPIKGFIDRWDPEGDGFRISDYKTGKTPRPQHRDKKFQQLLIYADALSTMMGISPKSLHLLYIKDGTRLQRMVTTKDINTMRNTVSETYKAVLSRCETGVFEPIVNSLCGYCSFKPICPAWKKS